MPRVVRFCALLIVLAAGSALADEEAVVLKVEKIPEGEGLRALGLQYLTDFGDAYLVQCDAPAVAGLDRAGWEFTEVIRLCPGDEAYLLRPRSLEAEAVYSGALIEVASGVYLTAVRPHRVRELGLLPFSKVRLLPGSFPHRVTHARMRPLKPITPKLEIQNIIAGVSGDTLWRYISELSGMKPAAVGGHTVSIPTRYSYSALIDTAAAYIYERFKDYGLDVDYHYYTVGTYAFYSTCFVDSLNGWVVGNSQRVYRTRDGGLSWYLQEPGSPPCDWWGVSFVDTLSGWVAGSNGRIYHTADGGATWSEQPSPFSITLREIQFLDTQNGWIAGYAGTILNTTDGGATWTNQATGRSDDIYGLHFISPNRGWACGANGTILFWDGATWTAQTSGTPEDLLDIGFGGGNVGWAVGGGATILKTSDGGATWSPQAAPAGVNPSLKGVSFVDTLDGWAAGLSGTVIHTGDGGATWSEQGSGTLFGLRWIQFINDLEGWAAGYGSTIHHTADGGLTWESQRENLPDDAVLGWKNVVATKPGTSSTDQVVICGHFDSISEDPVNLAPGADDNATGTVAVLEAARLLAECQFEKTIRFLCVSGEEQGLFGSGEYATDAKFAGDVITGVLNFDMIGYVNSVPEDIDVIGDDGSEWLVDFTLDCMNAYVPTLPTLKIINPYELFSDHASFWRAGYHALEAIEDDNLTYPYYHTINDTLGNLTRSFTVDVVRGGIAALAELAVRNPDSGATDPGEVVVVAAHPNPFRSVTTISFTLGRAGEVRAVVYDVEGRVVSNLHDGPLAIGSQRLRWQGTADDGRRVAPGIYFVNVATGVGKTSARVVLLR